MFNIKTLDNISNIINDTLKDEFIIDNQSNADAILVRSSNCHELEFDSNLKAIARAGAGTNNIPIDRCTNDGIVVFNTPGANANAVKELVFASIMMVSRNLVKAVEWCQTLPVDDNVPAAVEKGKKAFIGPELAKKTLGVIGLGDIGVIVANQGISMGMNVCGYDPFISVEHAWGLSHGIERALSLEELVAKCDYISIHVPFNKHTKGYFNKDLCALMKKNAILCNFSRAEVVDEEAVVAALENDAFSKYIVDFPTKNVLNKKNVICIPHLGASTPESEENCAYMAAKELKEYLIDGNIKNSVNFPECELARSGEMRICIIHKNTPKMIHQFVEKLSALGINITNMLNKSRDEIAYTILDIDEKVDADTLEQIQNIEGVIRTINHN